jgi:hypothetical protein
MPEAGLSDISTLGIKRDTAKCFDDVREVSISTWGDI